MIVVVFEKLYFER